MRHCAECKKDKPKEQFGRSQSICITCREKRDAAAFKKKAEKRQLAREKKKQNSIEAKRLARVTHHTRKHAAKVRVANKQKKEEAQQANVVATQELAKRELARRSLVNFITRFKSDYQAGWVHKIVCAKLEKFAQDVIDKKSPRLMVFMPPRTGKSLIASQDFPSWILGHYPQLEFIAASYAVSLPLSFSRKVKDRLADPMYQAMFEETKLHPKVQAAEHWMTTEGGGYIAAGVGGGITGRGADILNIDDPVKDAQEADSETVQEAVWDWYGSTARTRLAPGGGVLLIQTRWSDRDLAGRLLEHQKEQEEEFQDRIDDLDEKMKATEDPTKLLQLQEEIRFLTEKSEKEIEKWDVLSLAAINTEHDEFWHKSKGKIVHEYGPHTQLLRRKNCALHPERFDEIALARIKRVLQPRHWSALYQQNPVPDEGLYFRKEMFRYEPKLSDQAWRRWNIFIAWDLAIGQRQTNDWTVGLIGAHDPEDRLHLLDMVRVKTDMLAETIVGAAVPYKAQLQKLGLEQGQIQMAVMPTLKKEMRRERMYMSLDDTLKPVTDKLARARPAQGWLQQGRILLPQGEPWVEVFTSELLRFPNGTFDDIVDSLAWLVRMVAHHEPPRMKKKKKKKGWKDKMKGQLATRGRVGSGNGAMSA